MPENKALCCHPSLQVQSAAGLWHFVQPRSNQLLVLAGHALEYATCGLIHSSRHRVGAVRVCGFTSCLLPAEQAEEGSPTAFARVSRCNWV